MTTSGYKCPTDPTHGQLLFLATDNTNNLYCPHSGHDKPQTNALFSLADVDSTYKYDIIATAKAAHIKRKRTRATHS